jgi:hypothetical protein
MRTEETEDRSVSAESHENRAGGLPQMYTGLSQMYKLIAVNISYF